MPVTKIAAAQGGAWGLILDLASPELKALLKRPERVVSEVDSARLGLRSDEAAIARASYKYGRIAPILQTTRYSPARAVAFCEAARQGHDSERALREWVQAFEAGGMAALLPVFRNDRGKGRVVVSRKWDKAIDLPDRVRVKLAERIAREGRSMVANDGTSVREVIRAIWPGIARRKAPTCLGKHLFRSVN